MASSGVSDPCKVFCLVFWDAPYLALSSFWPRLLTSLRSSPTSFLQSWGICLPTVCLTLLVSAFLCMLFHRSEVSFLFSFLAHSYSSFTSQGAPFLRMALRLAQTPWVPWKWLSSLLLRCLVQSQQVDRICQVNRFTHKSSMCFESYLSLEEMTSIKK